MSKAYADAGVNYAGLDPFKLLAIEHSVPTAALLDPLRMREVPGCRGESYYLVEDLETGRLTASVLECLGTKSVVAQAMYELTGSARHFVGLGQDTVAMAVNDQVTSGIPPAVVHMYIAAGSSVWFEDLDRARAILRGWQEACKHAGCAWGGGETPALKGVIDPNQVDLAASTWGSVSSTAPRILGDVQDGDAIVLIESSGIHANGLSMARKIAEELPQGFLTPLDRRTYGEVLLDPTEIYVGVVMECSRRGIPIHYAVNITGHGWRKLMRLDRPFRYEIETWSNRLPIFEFIQKHRGLSDHDMFSDFNMGAGFALYVPNNQAHHVVSAAARQGLLAVHAGRIHAADERSVHIAPYNITFAASELAIR